MVGRAVVRVVVVARVVARVVVMVEAEVVACVVAAVVVACVVSDANVASVVVGGGLDDTLRDVFERVRLWLYECGLAKMSDSGTLQMSGS